MRILVTFAAEAEFGPWRARRGFQACRPRVESSEGHESLYEAVFDGCRVRVLLTGIGLKSASRSVESALQGAPDACVSSGLAGALCPEYRVGDIVAARRVVRPGSDAFLSSDDEFLTEAVACGAKLGKGLVTSDALAVSSEQKCALAQFGDTVDMESYAVLKAAHGFGVPAIAVRGISDAADEELPLDFSRVMNDRGEVEPLRLLGHLARRPRCIPSVVRFGRQCREGTRRLANFLDRYVVMLAARRQPLRGGGVEEVTAK
jgi:adenosylhomocysteine nucleosidase